MDKRLCARAAVRRISAQFPPLPEARFLCAIVGVAVADLVEDGYRRSAKAYLSGEIKHAELCGVDSAWVRETLQKVGLL